MLLLLSFPPLHLLLPPFVALVPFALFVEGLPGDGSGARAAVRGGLLLGAAYFGGLLYWMLVALIEVTDLALLLYLAVVAVLAALTATVAWALHRLRHRGSVPLWIALPLAWTAGEWLRANLPLGLAFPWLGLGTSLTGFPELVGTAELVGARGVTFWLALVSGVTAEALVRRRRGRAWRGTAVALVALVALPAAWGVWRAHDLSVRPAARVGVVQPELPGEGEVGRDVAAARRVLASPELLPDSGTVDLLVWPETAFPVRLDAREGRRVRSFARDVARRIGAPVLLGAFAAAPGPGRHNGAFLVGQEGPTGFAYHKRFLVPVVERTPLLPGVRLPDGVARGEIVPGSGWPVGSPAPDADVRFGVLICYEAAFSAAARAYRARNADFLVNVSNDAWYGLDAPLARTTGLWQHPAHLVMRAVETRTGAVRSANGGISMLVDPSGRIRQAGPLGRRTLLMGTVRTTDVRTLYVRLGDLCGRGAAAATALLLLTPLAGFVRTRAWGPG